MGLPFSPSPSREGLAFLGTLGAVLKARSLIRGLLGDAPGVRLLRSHQDKPEAGESPALRAAQCCQIQFTGWRRTQKIPPNTSLSVHQENLHSFLSPLFPSSPFSVAEPGDMPVQSPLLHFPLSQLAPSPVQPALGMRQPQHLWAACARDSPPSRGRISSNIPSNPALCQCEAIPSCLSLQALVKE